MKLGSPALQADSLPAEPKGKDKKETKKQWQNFLQTPNFVLAWRNKVLDEDCLVSLDRLT